MSRICVKNLPKYVVEDQLKEHFSQKGQVTDSKLMRTKDGKSRQFGFVGFRTQEEAQGLVTCEIARKIGDKDLPRPWSKYSLKKQEKHGDKGNEVNAEKDSAFSGLKRQEKRSKTKGEIDDPMLQEFLEVMKPHSTSQLWGNDTLVAASFEQSKIVSKRNIKTRIGEDKSNVTDAKSDSTDEEDDLSSRSDKEEHRALHDTGVSDMDYLKSKIKKKWSDSDSDEDDDNDNQNDDTDSSNGDLDGESDRVKDVQSVRDRDFSGAEKETKGPSKEIVDKLAGAVDTLSSPKDAINGFDKIVRLFITNLPYSATEEELEEHFSKFGDISEVHIVVDKETKRSKGFGYVRFSLPESAVRALKELNNSSFQGRLLHVERAIEKISEKQEMSTLVDKSSNSFKRKREEERKEAESSGNTQAWNPFYMCSDTVVEYITRKFGVSKNDFLDKEAEDLAVRTALGETQVIAETKKALAKSGVNVTSLEELIANKSKNLKRSNHVILVKNLPSGSSESELAEKFGKFGKVDKINFPPTKTSALIFFLEPSEAREAFNGLHYKCYKNGILYLEWAPSNILAENNATNRIVVGEEEVERVRLKQEVEGLDPSIDHDRNQSRSLYVKNLKFKTSDESLKKHFTELVKGGQILSARVKKRLKDGKNVSKGFGFIECDSVDTAINVCRDLHRTVLDGHRLTLELCRTKEGQAAKNVDNDKSSTKLIVRNVAFEATKKDLRQLFSTFGQIKRLKLPKRFGKHRGFAFVEFVTKQEAQNALEALASTHLSGRRLVMERANEGESLEELRERTAAQFSESQSGLLNSAKMSQKRKKKLGGFKAMACLNEIISPLHS